MEDAMVVITTVGDEEQGQLIAQELVARRQAACVNLVPGVRSFYRWQGEICDDRELLLLIKTTAAEFGEVSASIHELHSYDLPEILAFPIAAGEPGFLTWLVSSLDKGTPAEDAGSEPDDT